MAKAKQIAKPQESELAAEAGAVLDFGIVDEAARLRCYVGVLVDLGSRWRGVQPRIVSHRAPGFEVFAAELRRKEVSRYNIEHRPKKVLFHPDQLPDESKRRVDVAIILHSLRGDGKGSLGWIDAETGEPQTFRLDDATTEDTREAFGKALAAVDLEMSPWVLTDLLNAGGVLDDVTDDTILEAEKKRLACGLRPSLDRIENRADRLLENLAGAESALRLLAKEAERPAAEKTPTSKRRGRRTA